MAFAKATKKKSKLRLAVIGPAGSGKTYTSLQIASLLGTKIAVVDSERGSASKYSHRFAFDVDEPDEFSLRTYLTKVEDAKKAGYDVLVLDSFTHVWSGKGGALEQVDKLGGNKFSNGWKTVSPLQNQLTDAILNYPGHVICTMRSKMEYVVENVDGKAIPKKVGLKPVQREDVEYEFDVIMDLTGQQVHITKSRCETIDKFVGAYSDIPKVVESTLKWLNDGAEEKK